MQRTLPGLKNERNVPAHRRDLDDHGGLPYRVRHSGEKEAPRHQGELGVGGRVAFCLRVLPRPSPACIHDGFWDTRGNQPRRDTLLGPQENRALQAIPFDRGEPTSHGQRLPLTASGGQEGGLMIEPTSKIGANSRKVCERFELKIA